MCWCLAGYARLSFLSMEMIVSECIAPTVTFVGGIDRVTGSSSLFAVGDKKYLVDCGITQGDPDADAINRRPFPFSPASLTAVYLTHAHLDHCGLIPRLYAEGFKGPVICTRATAELSQIVMYDTVHISGLYTAQDVEKVRFIEIDRSDDFVWGKPLAMDDDLWEVFHRGSHILGSASVEFLWKDASGKLRSIHFSGDIGTTTATVGDGLLRGLQYPRRVDYLVSESTYGAEIRDRSRMHLEERLAEWNALISSVCVDNKGTLLAPTFSIHRTPEIALDIALCLSKYYPHGIGPDGKGLTVYFESGGALKAARVYSRELARSIAEGGDSAPMWLNSRLAKDQEPGGFRIDSFLWFLDGSTLQIGPNRMKWDPAPVSPENGEPRIIVTSSGMCDAGPVVKHLYYTLTDEINMLVLTGYAADETNARRLMDWHTEPSVATGDAFIHCDDDRDLACKNIRAHIEKLDCYSGHADVEGILDYVTRSDADSGTVKFPRWIFLNHGEREARDELRVEILKMAGMDRGDEVLIPEVGLPGVEGTCFELDRDVWVD